VTGTKPPSSYELDKPAAPPAGEGGAVLDGPEYVERILRRLPAVLTPDELPFHLGHFEPGESANFRAAQRRLDQLLISYARLNANERVLDVGCGLGGTLFRLANAELGLSLTGLDASRAQLRRARAHLPAEVRLVHGDACALPFEDQDFDVIFALECAFHFPSRRRFFAQAARVLRCGGRLLLTDFEATPALRDASTASAALDALVLGLAPWPDPRWLEGTLDELADEAGFDAVWSLDATAHVLPGFSQLVGEQGSRDPTSVRDVSDRGTAALGWLLRHEFFTMRYASFTRRAR
jgi:ubiquinone/menaquinone biosynthesis C-methylase UbiE